MTLNENKRILTLMVILGLMISVLTFGCAGPEVVDTPDPNEEPDRPVPPRPGTRGLYVTGPRIEIPLFAIDQSRGSGVLDWSRLQRDYPSTDITVPCEIDSAGNLEITYSEINVGNHEDAWINLIEPAMKTWKYVPIKSGRIRFWFNLPSIGTKLTVYARELRTTDQYREIPFIRTGYLFNIKHIGRRVWKVN